MLPETEKNVYFEGPPLSVYDYEFGVTRTKVKGIAIASSK